MSAHEMREQDERGRQEFLVPVDALGSLNQTIGGQVPGDFASGPRLHSRKESISHCEHSRGLFSSIKGEVIPSLYLRCPRQLRWVSRLFHRRNIDSSGYLMPLEGI